MFNPAFLLTFCAAALAAVANSRAITPGLRAVPQAETTQPLTRDRAGASPCSRGETNPAFTRAFRDSGQ